MKFIRLLIIFILLFILLTSCNRIDQQSEQNPTPEQTATGGVAEPAENINVKDIDISHVSNSTVITISMLSGSRENGYPESKLVELPQYEITKLDSPQRLMITLENISFWDYKQKPSWILDGFVVGLFREVPADDNSLIIYVQLGSDATFTVDEIDGDLVITLTASASVEGERYYCVVDAFLEHQEGLWPDSIDMKPVMCADAVNKLLISQPFISETEAKDFMYEKNLILEEVIVGKKLSVVSLQPGTLPNYEIEDSSVILEDYSVILANDVVVDTPALIENGKYLDTAVDGRIAFTRSYMPDEPSLEQDIFLSSEKIWIQDLNGRITELNVPAFFSVDSAVFSHDGTKLAILDVSIEDSVLYVYDFDSGVPYNLGEEGFGSITDCFAWSDQANILYAMTGFDERSRQLLGCEFAEGAHNIFTVEEFSGGSGSLAVSDGRIFFADRTASDKGIVYEIGDTRAEITTGVDFKVSSDNKTLLVLESYSADGEDRITNLKLCDIETLECSYVAQDIDIESFDFSQNLSKVFYTTSYSSKAIDDYQYEFVTYDIVTGSTQSDILCSTAEFVVADEPGVIYFITEIIDSEQRLTATFKYDLNN